MAIGTFNNTNIAVRNLKDILGTYADETIKVKAHYTNMIHELQSSFTDSQNHWLKWAADEKQKASKLTGEILLKIDEITEGMSLIEKQLCEVDKSYEKRRKSEYARKVGIGELQLGDDTDFLALINEKLKEAKAIAEECSLSSRSEIIQEIGMFFSRKRLEKYERLYTLISHAKSIRERAFADPQQELAKSHESTEKKKEDEINKAADETAALIQVAEDKLNATIAGLSSAFNSRIEAALSKAEVQDLAMMSRILATEDALPDKCREHVSIGTINIDLSEFLCVQEVVDLINDKYAGHIFEQHLNIPAIYDLREQTNFCFMTDNMNKAASKNSIHSVMNSLLRNEPASRQEYILFDPEGRSKGFDLYLDFFKLHNDIMGDKINTTQAQMRQQLEYLCSYIDDVGQTKFIGYNNIFEYNEGVFDKQESLKCLCIMDFPKYFDEGMLDTLYNVIKNGTSYGVNVMLQYCINDSENRLSQNAQALIDKICSEMTCFSFENNSWKFLNGVGIAFNPIPTKKELFDFNNQFSIQYDEIKKAALPLSRVFAKENWYSGDSTEILSIPIGKNEDGDIQSIEFGDAVGNGTSHYALIIGSTGSGKSTLLHTIIMNAIAKYDPNELSLYLMDFKSGTEFKIYAEQNIPHIKLLALDAMQEFGQSILDNLWEILQERSKAFKDLLAQDINVKDITQYRKLTGKKMPRILVIVDEFQMLFSEDNNRKIAYACGARMADFISLARVYGIHFILSTQTLSRLSSGFSIRKATLNEMHVRIGLQCTEAESSLLFGDTSGKIAFGKMGTEKGSAVYVENDIRSIPVGFKVAYCDQEAQERILDEVSHRFSILEQKEKTKVFIGDSVPEIIDCEGFINPNRNESIDGVSVYLGEPIKIAQPITLNIGRTKRNNLLVVGSEQEMLDRIVGLYVLSAIKTHPYVLPAAINKSVYLIDGLSILGENMGNAVKAAIGYSMPDIKLAKNNVDAISFINEVYDIYESRRKRRMDSNSSRKEDFNIIHLIVHNFQWVDSMNLLMTNKSISEFTKNTQSNISDNSDELFGFIAPEKHQNDVTDILDNLITQTKISTQSNDISPYKKFLTLIESGYIYGINFVLSCPDYQAIKELMYEVIPKFTNRILFSLSNNDADRIIQEAKTENLRSNIVVYSDGISPSCQFKPYGGISKVTLSN